MFASTTKTVAPHVAFLTQLDSLFLIHHPKVIRSHFFAKPIGMELLHKRPAGSASTLTAHYPGLVARPVPGVVVAINNLWSDTCFGYERLWGRGLAAYLHIHCNNPDKKREKNCYRARRPHCDVVR